MLGGNMLYDVKIVKLALYVTLDLIIGIGANVTQFCYLEVLPHLASKVELMIGELLRLRKLQKGYK
jgi:hypothetical protein